MKKLKYIIFALVLFIFVGTVHAAPSYSVTVNKFSVQSGGTVTLTIRLNNVMGWDVSVTSAGNTDGCSNHWVDDTGDGSNTTKTLTTTCKASSPGTFTLVVSGKISDNELNVVNVSDTTKITVTEYVAPTKSSVNKLNSLEVQGYELTPEFDPDVLEYSTTVPSGTKSVNINITKKDSKSIANGDFKEVTLEEGANRCVITVTAEDGSKRTYVVVVNVESEDPITVTVDGKEYTVIQKADQLEKPNGFELSNVEIDEKSVPSFYNGNAKITLVGLKDADGNIGLYVYKDGNFSPYEVIEVNGFSFLVMSTDETLEGFSNTKSININDKDYVVYYNDNEDIVLIYGMNVATGNVGWYRYDTEEKTFLRYKEESGKVTEKKEKKDYFFIAMLFAGCLGVSIIILLILLAMNNSKDKKNKKLIAILENVHPEKKEKKVELKDADEEIDNSRDLRFLEFIDREAEESRNEPEDKPVIEETEEEIVEEEEPEEQEPQELSKRELKKLAKQLKKEEEREAKEMREEFLATRENVIISDEDILEEIPNSEEVLYSKKNKKKNKKKKR